MTQKPLDPNADALRAIITETFARIGRVERDSLNVEARGRGIEVGRALAALKDAGLVEEYTTKPGFLRRLFGAKPHVLLRPVHAPEASAAEKLASEELVSVVSLDAPVPAPSPAAPEPDFAPPAETVAEPAPVEAPAPVTEAEPQTAARAEPVGTPEPETAPPATPVEAPVASSAAQVDTASEAPAALQATDAPLAEVKPDIATPEAPAKVAVHVPPPRVPHFAPDDYTDKVGGGDAIEIGSSALDPEVLDGLRETLSDLGMELTMAGEALISDRMGRGDSAGDALSQVVLFAFAHAVHYDLLSGGGMQALGLTDYAIEVMQELEKLRDAGAIASERFEMDMRCLWSFVGDTEAGELLRADRAAEVLTDPMGGAAPTAILPEDIQTAEDPDSED